MKNDTLDAAARALGRLPSGLAIVVCGTKESPKGFLGSWIQQASFHPLRLTVAVNKERGMHSLLAQPGTPFSINILDKDSNGLMKPFFGKQAPFEQIKWEIETDFIFLPEALSLVFCRTAAVLPAGDHDVILADVVSGRLNREAPPLTHVRATALNY